MSWRTRNIVRRGFAVVLAHCDVSWWWSSGLSIFFAGSTVYIASKVVGWLVGWFLCDQVGCL